MTLTISLPYNQDGTTELRPYTLLARTPPTPAKNVRFNRVVYSAAHVVADPLAVGRLPRLEPLGVELVPVDLRGAHALEPSRLDGMQSPGRRRES